MDQCRPPTDTLSLSKNQFAWGIHALPCGSELFLFNNLTDLSSPIGHPNCANFMVNLSSTLLQCDFRNGMLRPEGAGI